MKWISLFCAVAAVISEHAQGVVSLTGTRLVFDGRFHEASIEITNQDPTQALVQAWLTSARGQDDRSEHLPFVVTPHLVQLPPQGRHMLRILYEGVGMPSDRESLLHLYVLQVPRRIEGRQQLNIAVRQRINVFYRPVGLSGDPADAAQALTWQWSQSNRPALEVRNPTPFHVSLHNLSISGLALREDLMIAPFAQHRLPLPAGTPATPGPLSFTALTDYGGSRPFCAQPEPDAPFNARPGMAGTPTSIGKCRP
jgi:P pilus assembly chaperone PapD